MTIREFMQESLEGEDYTLKTDQELLDMIGDFGCGMLEFYTADIEVLIKEKQDATEWISIKDKEPEPGQNILVFMDYSKYNRGTRIEMASVHYAYEPRPYGGPNSLTGQGFLQGTYFAIPAIVAPGIVTHWKQLPDSPK